MNMGQKGGSKMPVTYKDWTLRLFETQDYPILRLVTYRNWASKLLKTQDYSVLNLGHLKIRDQTDQS